MEARYYYYCDDRSISSRPCSKFHERRRERSRIETGAKKKSFTFDRIEEKTEFAMLELRDFDGERLACECRPESSVLTSDAYAGDDDNDLQISTLSSSTTTTTTTTTNTNTNTNTSTDKSFSSLRRIQKKRSLPIYILPRMAALFIFFVCILMQDGQSTYAAFTTEATSLATDSPMVSSTRESPRAPLVTGQTLDFVLGVKISCINAPPVIGQNGSGQAPRNGQRDAYLLQ
ncbi:hypothetical protein HZH66_011747 [Vespula vulgaris]|uniref:Uncharacterized protein n=1 Tax=Vespula vulgaris TaxID=7454 RepID=A0A834MUQ1_VESVU|nr:hypothetical protein HZH66_011747 [Vespula vulgaris]